MMYIQSWSILWHLWTPVIGQMKLGKCHMTIRQCTMGQFYGMYSNSDWLNEALTLIAWSFVASLDTCDW